MTRELEVITSAVDDSLDFVGNFLNGLIHSVYSVPEYMVDNSKSTNTSDWCYWKPLNSNLTFEDFERYEKQCGIKLPTSYKEFLSYKFFIDLNFGHEVIFFKHTKSWLNDNLEFINQWGKEFTIERGLLPFAEYSDWGLVCFDSNKLYSKNEYDIVYIDHENMDTFEQYKHGRFGFLDLISEMHQRLRDWKVKKINGG